MMMKRTFKLLKEIPELRYKVGHILEINSAFIEYHMKCPNGHIMRDSLIRYDPAKRPDLWEEIKPLFTTEDGFEVFYEKEELEKNIYGRHNIFYVNPDDYEIKSFTNLYWYYRMLKEDTSIKYFSSKEKAEEWIYQNKPRFSFQDIIFAFDKIAVDTSLENNNIQQNLINSLEKHCL